jgi:predicted transposase/invertase (TIGR01784 family)
MERYLDPKNDLLFKKIFGEHKELLISFLNAFLPLEPNQEVKEIEYLSPEQVPVTPLGKNSIVDVKCTDNRGRAFIVEMQTEWSTMFRNRLLVNGSKAVVNQMNKRELEDRAKDFSQLKPVYVLAVIDDEFSDKNKKEWYHHLKIMNPKNPNEVIKGLEFVLLELPKFNRDTWTLTDKRIAVLWLRFLRELEGYSENLLKELSSDKLIQHAVEICRESALTHREREIYDKYRDEMMWQNGIKNMEKTIAENKKTIVGKNKSLAEKDKSLIEKDKSLVEKDAEIEKLKAFIENMKKHGE